MLQEFHFIATVMCALHEKHVIVNIWLLFQNFLLTLFEQSVDLLDCRGTFVFSVINIVTGLESVNETNVFGVRHKEHGFCS